MEGAIDLRTVLTVGGILCSVAGAAAVGKMQLKVIQETLQDIEARIRKIDQRIDGLENAQAVLKQRTDIMAKLNAPEVLATYNREVATIMADIKYLKVEAERQHKIHNGSHPVVASERKGV